MFSFTCISPKASFEPGEICGTRSGMLLGCNLTCLHILNRRYMQLHDNCASPNLILVIQWGQINVCLIFGKFNILKLLPFITIQLNMTIPKPENQLPLIKSTATQMAAVQVKAKARGKRQGRSKEASYQCSLYRHL